MRKKSGFTIVEQAIMLVPEFESVVCKLEQQVTLRGQSKSTLKNHIRRIALFVVHFGKLLEQIDSDEINEFLVALARDPRSQSRSSFKHMVYGLRYYYRLLGMNKNAIALPSLKKEAKLPVILNQQELKELFAAPTLLKQRVVLALIYPAGLGGHEEICQECGTVRYSTIVAATDSVRNGSRLRTAHGGDRTSHSIRTFTVSYPLQDIHLTENGRISDIRVCIFIRYTN